MRPLLGLLAYMSIAGDHERALPGAAAVELGHNFSLVHDDIEDNDTERHHRPTLWTVHGIPQAINTGDLLFSLSRIALHRLSDLGFSDSKVLRMMKLYDRTCVALCEGQYLDIASSASDRPMSVELYFEMIGRKTAALIAASIEAGALLATDDDDVVDRYRRFGWALGLAFQLNDDLLGIWGDERTTGKEPTDVARRKKTLPVLYAFEHAGPEDRERLAELAALGSPDPRRRPRDRRHPRPLWRAGLHPGAGPPAARRGTRRARRDGRGRRRRAREAARDHPERHHRLTRISTGTGGRPTCVHPMRPATKRPLPTVVERRSRRAPPSARARDAPAGDGPASRTR